MTNDVELGETVHKRLEWVDFAKGVGIFLVVLGHTTLPLEFRKWIYSFHMPLFFFLSGYFYRTGRYNFRELINKRCKTLIVPFLVFVVFNWFGFYILSFFGENRYDIVNVLVHGPKDPIWFLTTLFVVELCHHLIDTFVHTINKKIIQNLIWITLSIILIFFNYIFIHLVRLSLPYELVYVPHYLLFYIIGQMHWVDVSKGVNYWFILILFVVDLCLEHGLPYGIGMSKSMFLYTLSYVVALLGIYIVLNFSKLISLSSNKLISEISKIVSFYGRNSIVVLGLHTVFVRGIKYVFNSLGIDSNFSFPIRQLVLWIILALAIIYINKYTPWALGKKYETKLYHK